MHPTSRNTSDGAGSSKLVSVQLRKLSRLRARLQTTSMPETRGSQAFPRTPAGVAVVAANNIVPASHEIYAAPRQRQIRLESQIPG